MTIFKFADQFMHKLFKEMMFFLKYLLLVLFGCFMASALWSSGLPGKIGLIIMGVYLIGISAVKVYNQPKKQDFNKKVADAADPPIVKSELQKEIKES